MILYLAGGVTGNISKLWRAISDSANMEEAVRIYLAGSKDGRIKPAIEAMTKIFLAEEHPVKNGKNAVTQHVGVYLLESFYYAKNNKWMSTIITTAKDFLLDSGAFSFMNNATHVDFDLYVEEYAEYIKKHNIKYFFELDIDSVAGLKEVERLRAKLETLTGKQCIPVWHKSRGKEYWTKMCSEYKYVAIGGIVTKEIERKDYKYFPYFLEEAKRHGTKVHALGFTNLQGLTQYPFYSVDSTAWLCGNRGGYLYRFNGKTLEKIDAPVGSRLHSNEAALHNFMEWVKFQKYAEANL